MVKPIVNSEAYKKLVKTLHGQSVAEIRFPQSSEITEIIAVHSQVACISCEPSSGRVNYGGRIVLTIVYADEEGKLCRMQKGAEFTHYVDDEILAPAQESVCALACEKTTVKRDGSSFSVAAIISANIKIYANCERCYVTAAEGGYLRTQKTALLSAITFGGECEVEDDFEADSVADVLIPSAKAVVLSSECGTGEVQISGELYLSLFAMRQSSPVCLERVIPFKHSLPCEDAVAGKTADVRVEIADLKVNATVNEEHGKCDVNLVCSLAFSGEFYCGQEVETADDAFSPESHLALSFNGESCFVCKDVKVYTQRVSGTVASKSKLGYDCKFTAVALPEAECAYNPVTNAAEGAVNCVLVYEQNGEVKGTQISLPFAAVLNGAAEGGESVELSVAVSNVSVKLRAEGEAEAEAVLKICAKIYGAVVNKYLSGIEEGEKKSVPDCAVSVFMPSVGDGLWEVAKGMNKSPDEVMEANPALTFPLSGKERILIYRRKQ